MFLKPKEKEATFPEQKIVDTLRALSIDMIDEAKSGHPGIALGTAPILYTLYAKHLNINPKDPNWINRDRFILSAGHASSLLYATLYMAGYDISLDDLKQFREFKSKTPGHPEYKVTPGVDMTTGPLGQGLSASVGVAIAETILEEKFRKKKTSLINYYTYVLCSDGDLMEGVTYEALSLAGTLKLNHLIVFYDDNKVCLDGSTNQTFQIDTSKYFQALNWNVINVDGDNLVELDNAITKAKASDLPSVIITKTTIGKYSKWENTNKVHGTPLSKEDITNIKNTLGMRDIPFTVSLDVQEEMQNMITTRIKKTYDKYQKQLLKLEEPEKHLIDKIIANDLSLDDLNIDYPPVDTEDESLRESSSKVLNSLKNNNPLFIGGSADLSTSTLTFLKDEAIYSKDNRSGRNIFYGVREHAMASIMNGISLSGIRNFASTYLAFSDYLKPALRLACQMNLANIYIFTHDSISVGKDGATHQPVEQLSTLRSIPNLEVFRPSDSNEIIGTYKEIASKKEGPSAIILGRNKTHIKTCTSVTGVKNGAYIVKEEQNPLKGVIISSGEELDLALEVSTYLEEKGYGIRVISMVSIERFLKQDKKYQDKILPKVKTFVIEASSKTSWYRFTKPKYMFTVDNFGFSGDKEDLLNEFGFTKEKITNEIEKNL